MKKYIIFLFLIFNIFFFINAQRIKSMEFNNQEITDILMVLAEESHTSIIPDETVTGKVSFYFPESDIDEALNLFLQSYKLFYVKEGPIIKVSKIKTDYNNETKLLSVKADTVYIESLLKKISKTIGKTILYDTLPAITISVDIENLSIDDVLQICTKKLLDYSIEKTDSYFYLKKTPSATTNAKKRDTTKVLQKDGDLYTLSFDQGRFLELLTDLFSKANKEYSLFVQSDTQLNNLYFANKDFDTMLKLILEQGNADYVEKNNIYYIIDTQKKNISSKLKQTEIINLTWLHAQDLPSLLPSELASGSVLKVDKNNNTILLTGTDEEIKPLKDFIKKVDIPLGGLTYKRIDIKYLIASDVISLIPTKLIQNQPQVIPNTNSILACGTNENLETLVNFINNIDIKKQATPIKLKYIQAETVLSFLPPSATKDIVIDSGYPNLVFYTGSEQNLNNFKHELEIVDRPKPQIRYQLLVIQYTKDKSKTLKPALNISQSTDDSSYVLGADLSNILTLSFDVIAKFGYQFAASLNSQIGDNTANVFTDTTLTALTGQEVSFQNTDTYRYIEYEYDSSSDTTTKTGTTQTITSGLIVKLNGWISGDNMITMTVDATISKQNSDSSSSSSTSVTTLPSTSERVVTTQVRTYSGEPVVISGLIKEDTSDTESRIPLLGRIPIIKYLFKQSSSSKNKTEIVIYIVPHLIEETDSNDSSLALKHYYETYVDTQK